MIAAQARRPNRARHQLPGEPPWVSRIRASIRPRAIHYDEQETAITTIQITNNNAHYADRVQKPDSAETGADQSLRQTQDGSRWFERRWSSGSALKSRSWLPTPRMRDATSNGSVARPTGLGPSGPSLLGVGAGDGGPVVEPERVVEHLVSDRVDAVAFAGRQVRDLGRELRGCDAGYAGQERDRLGAHECRARLAAPFPTRPSGRPVRATLIGLPHRVVIVAEIVRLATNPRQISDPSTAMCRCTQAIRRHADRCHLMRVSGMRRRGSRFLTADRVAIAALGVLALGGTASAASGLIDGHMLMDGTVTTAKISPASIGPGRLKDGGVTLDKLAPGLLAKLGPGAPGTGPTGPAGSNGAAGATGPACSSTNALNSRLPGSGSRVTSCAA